MTKLYYTVGVCKAVFYEDALTLSEKLKKPIQARYESIPEFNGKYDPERAKKFKEFLKKELDKRTKT